MKYTEPTRLDAIIWNYLNILKEQSCCIDKQVACVIVDEAGNIVSQGVNKILNCDKNCHDKEHRVCVVRHAEIIASNNLRMWQPTITGTLTAYVNLFPCAPCQQVLTTMCNEIVAFGFVHKTIAVPEKLRIVKDLTAERIEQRGIDQCLEELDYFLKPGINKDIYLIAELELHLETLKRILWEKDPEVYNRLRDERMARIKNWMHDYPTTT